VVQVIRPTDLVTVCLTSRALHKLAVVELYKEVTLEVGSHTDTRLTAFINPNNIGLKHLKKLDLYLAEHPEKCATLVNQANLAIRMLIEFLPEHQLEKFSWHPWTPFSADNLKLLYRKQKNMKWLEGISLDRNVLPELEVRKAANSIQLLCGAVDWAQVQANVICRKNPCSTNCSRTCVSWAYILTTVTFCRCLGH